MRHTHHVVVVESTLSWLTAQLYIKKKTTWKCLFFFLENEFPKCNKYWLKKKIVERREKVTTLERHYLISLGFLSTIFWMPFYIFNVFSLSSFFFLYSQPSFLSSHQQISLSIFVWVGFSLYLFLSFNPLFVLQQLSFLTFLSVSLQKILSKLLSFMFSCLTSLLVFLYFVTFSQVHYVFVSLFLFLFSLEYFS